MKLSELISALSNTKDTYGDLNVFVSENGNIDELGITMDINKIILHTKGCGGISESDKKEITINHLQEVVDRLITKKNEADYPSDAWAELNNSIDTVYPCMRIVMNHHKEKEDKQ